ncbi:STAS domain-containing protein [Micromonospora foliorum]|uniref:STAS domain-containing protein n=1 Tax=Micromonospora foliorum TaxID=2911210 RepID=UPI001EE86F1A|nr:STAS domain-containing protein [Micromonospora foliorum]MCG5438107.1 STAS domain-containing protein [Micromonospora foliorum]
MSWRAQPVVPGPAEAGDVLIRAAGVVDLDTVDLLRGALLGAVDSHARVCCDLSEVTFLSAAGANVLVQARNRADARGCRLSVRGANGMVRRVLQITGLSWLLG